MALSTPLQSSRSLSVFPALLLLVLLPLVSFPHPAHAAVTASASASTNSTFTEHAVKQWNPVVPRNLLQRVPRVVKFPVAICKPDVALIRSIATTTIRRLMSPLPLPWYIRVRLRFATPRIFIRKTAAKCRFIVKAYPRAFLRSLYVKPF